MMLARNASAMVLAAVLVIGAASAARAAACDSTMMALVFLGVSVDPILSGAPETADRLARFADKARLAEAEAKSEGWAEDVLAQMALLSDAEKADPPTAIFAPAQAVADAAGTLCPGLPMPMFPAPTP